MFKRLNSREINTCFGGGGIGPKSNLVLLEKLDINKTQEWKLVRRQIDANTFLCIEWVCV